MERAQVADHANEDLRGQILWLRGSLSPEISEDGGRQLTIEGFQRPGSAASCGLKHLFEGATETHADIIGSIRQERSAILGAEAFDLTYCMRG
jgi:hypothetical protein